MFLLELDRQGTLTDWMESRKAEEGPEFERLDSTQLERPSRRSRKRVTSLS